MTSFLLHFEYPFLLIFGLRDHSNNTWHFNFQFTENIARDTCHFGWFPIPSVSFRDTVTNPPFPAPLESHVLFEWALMYFTFLHFCLQTKNYFQSLLKFLRFYIYFMYLNHSNGRTRDCDLLNLSSNIRRMPKNVFF